MMAFCSGKDPEGEAGSGISPEEATLYNTEK